MIMRMRRLLNRIWLTSTAVLLLILLPLTAWPYPEAGAETEELMGLSLEELLQVTVTTAARKPQSLSDTPAAIFVVGQEDIQRSGARTLPDILRMVPGIQVQQVDASSWAVTSRGSNGIFANKLLVLMDGRTLYSPLFSGVRWDIQDTDLASIDRIEVIRGPGAAMWGANAVNGVINIITKHTRETDGFQAEAAVGDLTSLETTARFSGAAGDDFHYRVYGKYFDRDGYAPEVNGNSYDDWDMWRIGGRFDWSVNTNDEITLIAEVYDGSVGDNILQNSVTPPYQIVSNISDDPSGEFALARWNRTLSDTSDFQLKMYVDHTARDKIAPEEALDTIDVDFQHHFKLGSRHDLVWGLGVRRTEDQTTGSETVALDPENRTQRQYSGFIQDEIRLYREKVYLTLGTKVEKNNFSQSNTEWSPNVRLSWLMNDTNTAWASIAKAVRTPSRIEQEGRILGIVEPPFTGTNTFPVPFALTINGNPLLDSEEVIAYEIGYRAQPTRSMTLDVAFFFNDYKDIRTLASQGVFCQPAGLPISEPACFFGPIDYAELPLLMMNQIDQDTKGMEISMSFRIRDWWRIHGAYSYLKIDGNDQINLPVNAGEDSPEHQLSLRSSMNINSSAEFDFWMRYVDELQIQNVDSYVTLDARANWEISDTWQVSLTGRNLLDSSHLEFREEFGLNQTVEIPREFLAEIRWQF